MFNAVVIWRTNGDNHEVTSLDLEGNQDDYSLKKYVQLSWLEENPLDFFSSEENRLACMEEDMKNGYDLAAILKGPVEFIY
jgi:hypothetical protein